MCQYGFVFGVAHLSAMLASPFFASWTSRLGPRRVFLLGTAFQFLGGGILFGLLEHVRDPNTFLWMSYVLRYHLTSTFTLMAELLLLFYTLLLQQ